MERQIQTSSAPAPKLSIIASLAKGGTGASDDAAAAEHLGAIHRPALGEMADILRLESTGKFDSTLLPKAAIRYPQLSGEPSLYVGLVSKYTISNFDINETYTASISAGSVSVAHDILSIAAPSAPQVVILTINDRQISIPVYSIVPNQPTILSPVDNSTNVADTVIFYSSVYSTPSEVGDIHLSSDWELATDAEFTNIVSNLFGSTTSLLTWTVSTLVENQDYYIRTRQKGITYGSSQWSPVVHFKTRETFGIGLEQAKLVAPSGATGDYTGSFVAISSDGSKVAVSSHLSSPNSLSQAGAVYVFVRTGDQWSLEAKLTASDQAAGDIFGHGVSISSDGTRIVIGSQAADSSSLTNCGAVYVFHYSSNVWTQEQKIVPSDLAANDRFGFAVSMDSSGTRIAASSRNTTVSGYTEAGTVYVWTRTDTTWTQEARINDPSPAIVNLFGYRLNISYSGDRLAVGSLYGDGTSVVDSGSIHVFSRSDTTWSLEQKILPTDPVTGSFFSGPCRFTTDTTRLVIGCSNNIGSAYIFSRSGTTWTQEAKLLPSAATTNDQVGYSVAINGEGTVCAIGSPTGDTSLVDSGCVYVCERTDTTWTFVKKIAPSDPISAGSFGTSVAISNDGLYMAVGSIGAMANGVASAGAVYVYN